MEWVETTARSIEEAKSLALDQLGVDTEDAEFEVLEEPRAGLFGRMRGEARVRARVRPTKPRPKAERRDRKRKAPANGADAPEAESTVTKDGSPQKSAPTKKAAKAASSGKTTKATPSATGVGTETSGRQGKQGQDGKQSTNSNPRGEVATMTDATEVPPEAAAPAAEPIDPAMVGAEAAKFLEGLLSAFKLEGTVSCDQDGAEIDVRVDGADLGLMVGPRGATLSAVQELTRVVSQRRLGDHETRLRVDVAGYRERRSEALARFATTMADEVAASGVARVLEPMASVDRKVIHDTLSVREDVVTRSEGDDPRRRVVIDPVS